MGDFNNYDGMLLSPEADINHQHYMGMPSQYVMSLDQAARAMELAKLLVKLGTQTHLLGKLERVSNFGNALALKAGYYWEETAFLHPTPPIFLEAASARYRILNAPSWVLKHLHFCPALAEVDIQKLPCECCKCATVRHISMKPCATYHLGSLHLQIRELLVHGGYRYAQDPEIVKTLLQKGNSLFIAIL